MSGDPTDLDETELRALVDGADHDSVTATLLGGDDEYAGLTLYDAPAATYLEPGEQPHYALFNERKGVGVDDKRNTVTPDGSGLTVVLITDRRTLALVGQADGDELFEVTHERVRGVEYSTGIMKNRLVVTTPATTYHFWANASYDESDLAAAADALREYREAARRDGRTTTPGSTTADGGVEDGTDPASSTGTGGNGTGNEAASTAATRSGDEAGDDGGAAAESDDDPLDTLERLKELRDQGVITDEEFEAKKTELLDQI